LVVCKDEDKAAGVCQQDSDLVRVNMGDSMGPAPWIIRGYFRVCTCVYLMCMYGTCDYFRVMFGIPLEEVCVCMCVMCVCMCVCVQMNACVCVRVCVYIYIYIYIYVCVYIYTHKHAHKHTCIHTHIHTCIRAGIRGVFPGGSFAGWRLPYADTHALRHDYEHVSHDMHASVCVCVRVCACVCGCGCVNIYVYIYIYIYICICICICI
jgi:hypothetical protein